jgi:uncharacterized membrane protein
MLWHPFMFLGLRFFPLFFFLLGGLRCFSCKTLYLFLATRFLVRCYSNGTKKCRYLRSTLGGAASCTLRKRRFPVVMVGYGFGG